MRKLFTILIVVLLTASVFLPQPANAQFPMKMSYQAVIRNTSQELVKNQTVGMQVSILQGSVSGDAVYIETHVAFTNTNGLMSVEIGAGVVVSGNFVTINWANGPYFIKTEIDPTGGTNYSVTSTSQLLSVPYALHAKTAETVSGETDPVFTSWDKDFNDLSNKPQVPDGSETKVTGGTNITVSGSGTTDSPYVINASSKYYLGQNILGGIVFYLYLDQNGEQHGLIVSKTESTAQWQGTASITNAARSWDGVFNMGLMINSPAKTWVTENFSNEWYLPSVDELSLLWHNRFHVNKALMDGGGTMLSNNSYYWSSTEYNEADALFFYFSGGQSGFGYKLNPYLVRAVRAF